MGNPAFYQTAYLGGQGNLLGYSQFRFSGLNSVFNNLELRLKLADFANYILPGQLGVFDFTISDGFGRKMTIPNSGITEPVSDYIFRPRKWQLYKS